MKLIIAEKEAVADAIAQYLKTENIVPEKKGKYFKAGDYYIAWASGHLLRLKEPEEIDIKYKIWKKEDLPIFFEKWEKVIINENLMSTIKTLLNSSDVTEVLNTGDPDDEGQYLIDEILEYYKNKKPVKRLLINDPTVAGIKKSFENIKDNKDFISIGKSAYARAISDNVLGINLSRYFSLINKVGTLSIGRVQTPVLAMIVNRDKQIKNHIKEKYYSFLTNIEIIKESNTAEKEELEKIKLLAQQSFHNKELLKKYVLKLIDENSLLKQNYKYKFKYSLPKIREKEFPDKLIKDKAIFEEIEKLLKALSEIKVFVKKDFIKENPPLPFNLLQLQTYCSNKFNYSPDDVMNITQSLRDNYNAITYNRSDCNYLSEEQYAESPQTLPVVLVNLGIDVPEIDYNIKSKAFNNEKITAHTAIIPTNVKLDLSKFTEQERNVYRAIADYYIVQFLHNALKERTEAVFTACDENDFKVSSEKYIELGYRAYLREKETDDEKEDTKEDISALLPGIYTGKYIDSQIEEKETKPLKKYTEATIMSDMGAISKYVEDPEVKKILRRKDKDTGEKGSIGTPATRSVVLKTLYKRGYIEKQGKNVVSTSLGQQLIDILPKKLISADMTAHWWTIQEKIKNNETTEEELIHDVFNLAKNIISSEQQPTITKESTKEVIGTCPICKGNVFQGKTSTGKINYYCENYKTGCKFTLWEEMKHFDNILKITKTRAKNLIAGKKVSFKLKTASGKEYEGDLKLKINKINDKVYINFESVKDNKKSRW